MGGNRERVRTEIGHVVLTDRVGYSKLSMEHKAVLERELLDAVQTCPAVLEANPEDLILLDSGDGIALVFFNDPTPAAESALFLHEKVARTTDVRLRIGIHSGPLMRRTDATGKPNVTGPGIDKAQRTMSQADGSSVLVSEFFAENLRAFSDWDRCLFDTGEHEIKHGESLRIYSLVREVETQSRVTIALLYKRNAEPDETLLKFFEVRLKEAGYDLFIDRHMTIGVAWAQEIDRQIRQADAVVALISERSVGSEMLLYEVQTAVQEFELKGSPRVLPVRVGFHEPLSGDLGTLLNRFQYALWNGPADDERIFKELIAAITRQDEPVTATPIAPLEPAGGAVPLDSQYYIVRDTDHEFRNAIADRDSIVLVKGGRQMGKTSLLARGLSLAAEAGSKIVLTDFQSFSSPQLQTDERLYKSLAYELGSQLGLDFDIQGNWNEWLGANSNLERFVQTEILGAVEGHVIWALDEVDRLFTAPYATDFFGMIRSWHNRRALRAGGPWSRLTIAIAYATEAHLFITDLNQSPFNVGTRLTLSDFNQSQIGELNQRYGRPLHGEEENKFWQLTGGQPYLSRRGLDELVRKSLSYAQLETQAANEEGPFGDHLRRILIGVSNDPMLLKDVQSVLSGGSSPSLEGFYRLRSAGVFIGDSPQNARLRCRLYELYLRRHGL